MDEYWGWCTGICIVLQSVLPVLLIDLLDSIDTREEDKEDEGEIDEIDSDAFDESDDDFWVNSSSLLLKICVFYYVSCIETMYLEVYYIKIPEINNGN